MHLDSRPLHLKVFIALIWLIMAFCICYSSMAIVHAGRNNYCKIVPHTLECLTNLVCVNHFMYDNILRKLDTYFSTHRAYNFWFWYYCLNLHHNAKIFLNLLPQKRQFPSEFLSFHKELCFQLISFCFYFLIELDKIWKPI